MSENNLKLFLRLMNLWFGFVFVLFILSLFPHWQTMTFHYWLNRALNSLVLLFVFTIFLKDPTNKDIFLNLSLYRIAVFLSILNIFLGKDYFVGTDYTLYYFLEYSKMINCFLWNFAIIYIVLKYLFFNSKIWIIYLITLVVLVPVFVYNFYPYIHDPNFLFKLGAKYEVDFYKRMFLVEVLTLFFIPIYGYLLFTKDRILGEYIHSLMAYFFIAQIIGMVGSLSRVYEFTAFSARLYMVTIQLLFLVFIFFKKLLFICSEYGQFYEALVRGKIKLGKVRVQRRHAEINALLLRIIKIYFSQRRNYLVLLGLLATIVFSYFQFPKYFTINIATYLSCTLVLFYFISALYKKRAKRKYILP